MIVNLHSHTEYSIDCKTKIADILYIIRKYNMGLAITDHNECKGVIEIFKLKNKDDFIIPGIEVTVKEGGHILLYFFESKDLEDFFKKVILPNLLPNRIHTKITALDLVKEGRKHNAGLIVVPHPFSSVVGLMRNKIRPDVKEQILNLVDAIEIHNSSVSKFNNFRAEKLLKDNSNLAYTLSSDAHFFKDYFSCSGLINNQTKDIADFFNNLKSRKYKYIKYQYTELRRAYLAMRKFFNATSGKAGFSVGFAMIRKGVKMLINI